MIVGCYFDGEELSLWANDGRTLAFHSGYWDAGHNDCRKMTRHINIPFTLFDDLHLEVGEYSRRHIGAECYFDPSMKNNRRRIEALNRKLLNILFIADPETSSRICRHGTSFLVGYKNARPKSSIKERDYLAEYS